MRSPPACLPETVSTAVVVAGDLNDELEATTTQLLHGPSGSEIGTGGFDLPDTGDGQRLWNLAPLILDNQRFSRVFRRRGELIDHLLVSHVLVKAVQTVTTGAIEISSITEEPTERRDEPGSDHRTFFGELPRDELAFSGCQWSILCQV
ncbi:MAG: endonuclease/exonuclease/phosphatase family protein [Pseudonocardiaceae bacterium]